MKILQFFRKLYQTFDPKGDTHSHTGIALWLFTSVFSQTALKRQEIKYTIHDIQLFIWGL
jgi:hypothetical protein